MEPINLVNECHMSGKTLPSPDGVERYAVDLRLVVITATNPRGQSMTFRFPEQMARELLGALSQLLAQRQVPPPTTLQ